MFHLQLYRAAVEEPWITDVADQVEEFGLTACGLDAPLVCSVDPETLAEFLARETSRFHRLNPLSVSPVRCSPDVVLEGGVEPLQLALDLGFF